VQEDTLSVSSRPFPRPPPPPHPVPQFAAAAVVAALGHLWWLPNADGFALVSVHARFRDGAVVTLLPPPPPTSEEISAAADAAGEDGAAISLVKVEGPGVCGGKRGRGRNREVRKGKEGTRRRIAQVIHVHVAPTNKRSLPPPPFVFPSCTAQALAASDPSWAPALAPLAVPASNAPGDAAAVSARSATSRLRPRCVVITAAGTEHRLALPRQGPRIPEGL